MLVYPVCISLCMPIFLHHLVMEKERKLVYNMKTNGLSMFNYYFVNSVFNYCSYAITAFIYWFVGRYVFELDFFKDSHALLFL